MIDHEEFEYVLSEFGVSERTARQAFTIFTQVRTSRVSFSLSAFIVLISFWVFGL